MGEGLRDSTRSKLRKAFSMSSSRSSSPFQQPSKSPSPSPIGWVDPPLTKLELTGYKTATKQRLLDLGLAEDLRLHLPLRLQITHNWKLCYSLEQNGSSLSTLYSSSLPDRSETGKKIGYLLVVYDQNHDKFGCYLNEHLRPMDRRAYYGNGECFLWKVEKGRIPSLTEDLTNSSSSSLPVQFRLKVFPYTSLNDFIIYSNHSFISIGSGNGKFGLWIDENLVKGASSTVDTFGNEPLSREEQFQVMGLEIWKII
ncbi:unnamed protein product [Kuraishia capsulata CBS 1993]|uniref:Oxidation resistance protein 1 n=1 Tax=Kuraishia capsulata CBS 1993 TaxID=1382522 RepID=W6MSC5_9ASCO|nr:uncharacterized protein KUCA_T00005597001 [Kuraishia capsulata CBS 1993]CDK29604.1 unnamed protein product [Kuraishia capsulata CBS 1993]